MLRTLLFLLLASFFGLAQAQEIERTELPPEGRQVLQLIAAGGPFLHRRDGITFNNYEKRLPRQAKGHYREYTVPTPGLSHRGARRIVCGGARQQPDACYYTADHYRSFKRIRE